MNKLGGGVTALAIAGLLTAPAATPSAAVSQKPTSAFDGTWSVSVFTEGGSCEPSYRYPARIINGQVQQANIDFSYRLTGVVVSSGAIAVSITRAGQYATGYGRLRDGKGAGRWTTQNNQCFGVWNAVRRG